MLRFNATRVNAPREQTAPADRPSESPARESAPDELVAGAKPGKARHAGSALRRGAWGISALAAVALAVTMGYTAAFHDRVPPGVRALGLDLGGLRQPEAQAALAARLDALARTQPVLRVDDREVALPPGAFGQPATLASRLSLVAAQAGQERPLGSLALALRATASGGTTIQAPLVDEAALRAAVAALAGQVDRPALEPQVVIDRSAPQTTLRLQPGQLGRRLDVDQTAAQLAAAFTATAGGGDASGSRSVVPATFVDIHPTVGDAQIQPAMDRVAALLARPVAAVVGGQSFGLPPAGRLVERVDVVAGATGPDLRLVPDESAFGDVARRVVEATTRPPQDARLALRGDQVVVVPAVDGAAVDPAALRDGLVAGWLAGSTQIEVPLPPVAAQVSTEALQPVAAEANRLIVEALVVTLGERRWTLGRADLSRLLALPTDAAPAAPLMLDGGRLAAALDAMAAESARPATNPRLEVQDGQVVAVPGENGETLDAAATAAAVEAALHAEGDGRTVAAVTRPVAPSLSVSQVESARAQAARIIGGPLTVRYGAKAWTLSQNDLAGMLILGDSPGGVIPYLSRTRLLDWVQPIAGEVNPQLEQDYAAARQAWEARRQAAAGADAGAAPLPATDKPSLAANDAPPQRQWVDVSATAAAIWSQATQDTRVAAVRLTADDPAGVVGAQSAAGQAAQVAAAAAARGKWIDVNLGTQTLVAYEGDWPILTTLVSTGLANHPTPPGTYKVFSKLLADDMKGGSYATGDYYFLPKVPYVMYFLEGGYALHGTYWHHNFGHQMSHGCVNLPTDQSQLLFEWAPMGTTVVVHG